MKKIILIASMGLFVLSEHVYAQKVNTDSLTLISKMSSDQLKLGKLQNTLNQKTADKQDAAAKAQNSADENKTAAGRLGDNSLDRKLAKDADNKAGDARRDAKKARAASEKLQDLNKDIQDLQDQIAKNQSKLNKYLQAGMPQAPIVAESVPVPLKDSTQQQ